MGRRTPDGWTRLYPDTRDKLGTHFRHDASGWEIRHCGHPTALWPYYLIEPSSGRSVVSHNGMGFTGLRVAMAVVEDIVAGRRIATDNRCNGGMRVPDVTASGDTVEPIFDEDDPRLRRRR